MSYIEGNFFPLKVFVRNEYLYQNKKGHGELTEGVLIVFDVCRVKWYYFKFF